MPSSATHAILHGHIRLNQVDWTGSSHVFFSELTDIALQIHLSRFDAT
jgi:hypothetical protein